MEDRNNGFSLCRAKVKRTGQTAQIQNGLYWRPELRYQQRYQPTKIALSAALSSQQELRYQRRYQAVLLPLGPYLNTSGIARKCRSPSLSHPVSTLARYSNPLACSARASSADRRPQRDNPSAHYFRAYRSPLPLRGCARPG